jgi:glycosyltransferase involved in cell wall biosynthesis
MKNNKKLIYILNSVNRNDTQHYYHVINLLVYLQKNYNWEIILFSEKGGHGADNINGLNVYYLSNKNLFKRYITLFYQLLKYRSFGYKKVFIRISKPTTIISAIIGRFIGQKIYYWQSGTTHDLSKNLHFLKKKIEFIINKILFKIIHYLVTGPEYMIKYYSNEFNINTKKIILLYNDIDLNRFKPLSYVNNNNNLNLLIVHRFSPVRNTPYYFKEIVKQLNTIVNSNFLVTLHMIGEGPEIILLKEIANTRFPFLDIIFHGTIPNNKIQEYYKTADLFLMPSYREGFPRVVLESMAMGIPLVATNAGGTIDIVGPKQKKYIVDINNNIDFSTSIVDLLLNFNLRQELSNENLETVKKYSTDNVAIMYNKALSTINIESK